MKRRTIIGMMIFSLFVYLCPSVYAAGKIAIFDFDDRLDESDTVAKYIEKTLREQEQGLIIDQYSGKGDEVVAKEIMKQLDQARYDLIITVTSDALTLAQHFLKKTPTLYTNVNNPLFLGFTTLDALGGNISGASYYVPIITQLDFLKRILPHVKKLGFLFDEKNRSRQAEVRESRDVCKTLGFKYAIRLISRAEELAEKVEELLEEGAEAIVVTSSETIYENLHLFKPLCNRVNIPIYSYHRKAVENGAVAALASDFYLMVDKLVLPMALQVLREQVSPGTMPAAFLEDNLIFINLTEANKLNIKIPQEIVQQATEIY